MGERARTGEHMESTGGTPTIGIIGGMGPLATADLYRKIIEVTPAVRDQDHLHVIIDADPTIPDRTAALLGNGPDPLPKLVAAARRLEDAGAGILIMPCNTAHAFLPVLQRAVRIPFIDMTEEEWAAEMREVDRFVASRRSSPTPAR
jgi:aspartate racemase